jgi:NAD(P)H-flavin reductase
MNTEERLSHRLVDFEPLASQIKRFWLQPEQPFAYQAGDYIMLGFNTEDLKPFSIANAPRDDGLLELHIRNEQGSDWMKTLFALEKGATLYSSPAKPQMQLQPEKPLNLFIAGGTGLAPMKALLEARLAAGISQPTKLYMGARHVEELYLDAALRELAESTPLLEYIPVVSEDEAYQGLQGLVHQVALRQCADLSQTHVYVCGAWAMVKKAEEEFIAAGLNKHGFTH